MQRAKLSPSFFVFDERSVFSEGDWHLRAVCPPYRQVARPSEPRSRLFGGRSVVRLAAIDNPAAFFRRHFSPTQLQQLKERAHAIAHPHGPPAHGPVQSELKPLLGMLDDPLFHERFERHCLANDREKLLAASPNRRKVAQTLQLLALLRSSRAPMRLLAEQLAVSPARAAYLLRRAQGSRGAAVAADAAKLEAEIALGGGFEPALQELMARNCSKTRSLRALFADFAREHPDLPVRNVHHFRRLLLAAGFVHKPFVLRQPRPPRHTLEQARFLPLLMAELVSATDEFALFWCDESTICPANFQRRGWGVRGRTLHVSSSLRYDKLKLFGLLGLEGVACLRFLFGRNSQVVFDDFLLRALLHLLPRIPPRKTVVIFLDNSPIHKSRALADFCLRNGVVLLFGLAYNPAANPIELLWRFLKQPLRSRTDASS